MALDYGTNPTFAGRITPPDVNYPQGSSKDETGPGANDGMPYNKQRADDVLGYQQALLLEGNVTPNGSSDTAINSQYMLAAKRIFKSGRKNLLDNGEFRIWQEGTSFSITNDTVYTSDRFELTSVNGQTNVDKVFNQFPGLEDGIDAALKMSPQAGVSSMSIIQKVEASNAYRLSSKSVTFSAVVNTNEAVTLNMNYKTPSSTDNWSGINTNQGTVPVALNVGNNVVSVTFDNVSSEVSKGVGFEFEPIGFTPGFLELSIALVQVEVGTVATDFEYIPVADDFIRCQRYFEINDQDVLGNRSFFRGDITLGASYSSNVKFSITKVIIPTMSLVHINSVGFPATTGVLTVGSTGFFESRIANATTSGDFISTWSADSRL